jgi:hypothetical protein
MSKKKKTKAVDQLGEINEKVDHIEQVLEKVEVIPAQEIYEKYIKSYSEQTNCPFWLHKDGSNVFLENSIIGIIPVVRTTKTLFDKNYFNPYEKVEDQTFSQLVMIDVRPIPTTIETDDEELRRNKFLADLKADKTIKETKAKYAVLGIIYIVDYEGVEIIKKLEAIR